MERGEEVPDENSRRSPKGKGVERESRKKWSFHYNKLLRRLEGAVFMPLIGLLIRQLSPRFASRLGGVNADMRKELEGERGGFPNY